MKNNLMWNKLFPNEKIIFVSHIRDSGSYVTKADTIAPMSAPTFVGRPLYPVDSREDTVWLSDDQSTHIDFNQIVWWENPTLNLLYGKYEETK